MDQNSQPSSPETPIYQRTVAEHGDPREKVNECDRVIAQARARKVVVLS